MEETFADQVRLTVLVAFDTEIMYEPSSSANSTVTTKDTTKDIATENSQQVLWYKLRS